MIRFKPVVTATLMALFLVVPGTASAQAGQWEMIEQPGGYRVARVAFQGLATGLGLTCERGMPVIALGLQRNPARNPARVTISVDGAPFEMALVRNGITNVWVAGVRDQRLIEAMAAGSTAQIIVEGANYGEAPLVGSREAFAAALASCYREPVQTAATARPAMPATLPPAGSAPSRNSASGVGSNSALFADSSLPKVLRDDLADFAYSCDHNWEGQLERRGPALAEPAALQRADFNGDGAEDFVIDIGKLNCALDTAAEQQSSGGSLMVYTSQAGDYIHSLDVDYDNWRLVPAARGKNAEIFVHRDYVPEDPNAIEGEGDAVPLVDETIGMTGAAAWGPSQLGREDWRLGALNQFPAAIRDLFAGWDRSCRSVGRRLDYFEDIYRAYAINDAGDLNSDQRPDYVVDVEGVSCGVFGAPPVPAPAAFCGKDCSLIAIVSAADGNYVADRVQGSITLAGNGDPASTGDGKIMWPGAGSTTCAMWEITYQGTRQVRRKVPCPE